MENYNDLIKENHEQNIVNDFMVGNSKYSDNVWDLSNLIPETTLLGTKKRIRFAAFIFEDMKNTVKQYAYYKLGQIKPQTVVSYINGYLQNIATYCNENEITSFIEVTLDIFLDYTLWLRRRNVALSTGFHCAHVVEEIMRIGQIKGWNVSKEILPSGVSAFQLWNTKKALRTNKFKPIPEEVFNRILNHAVNDEKDIITKSAIIIQSQTGLRINEVLSIQEGCMKESSEGYCYMEVLLGKTEKGDQIVHKVFVNNLVKDTIEELSQETNLLRSESDRKELFLRKFNNQIDNVKPDNFNARKLKRFIQRWEICDGNGKLYDIKSHQFRATFVRELIKQKVPIAHVMKQFAHVSVEMTAHYLSLEEDEIKAIYSDLILKPNAKIAGLQASEIRNKLDVVFKGKTAKDMDDIILELSKTMSFNPLPTGICLYDFRRGNCTDGDGCFMYNCPNYVTEVSFLPILKDELRLLEIEMSRLKELGQEPAWQVQYVKWKYLKPLVEELEGQDIE